MIKKILHPGLGKCGTTAKQLHYWPEICSICNWNFISLAKRKDLVYDLKLFKWLKKLENQKNKKNLSLKKIHFNKNIFLSNEGFLEFNNLWDPEFYDESIKYLRKNFDKDFEILLTIRKPSDWLISNYLTYINLGGNLPIEKYYLKNQEYYKTNNVKKFNISKFNYNNLISKLKKKFKKVHIIFYEKKNLKTYNEIFGNIKNLRISNEKKIEKPSISYVGFKILFYLNNNNILRNNSLIKKIIRLLDKYLLLSVFKFPKKKYLKKIKFDIKNLDKKYKNIGCGGRI